MTTPQMIDLAFKALEMLSSSSPTLLAGAVIGAAGGGYLTYRFRHRFKDAGPATKPKPSKPKPRQPTRKNTRQRARR